MRPLRALLAIAAALLAACTSVPFDYPKEASYALPASSDTRAGAAQQAWLETHSDSNISGFIGLRSGIDGLAARLAMLERAQQSIDAQYFLLKPDAAGELFLGKMLRAADRGVRVRLLLDDIFTPRMDSTLSLLDSHPNIEVRLFNPVSRNSLYAWNFLIDFQRINRRMHNKVFVGDGSLAIVGGRNIAAEYFELKPQQAFDDFELLMIGEIVPQLSASFDDFWNSPKSVPAAAFGRRQSDEKLQDWRGLMDKVVSGELSSPYAAAINQPIIADIRSGKRQALPVPAVLVYDPPEKLQTKPADSSYRILIDEMLRRFFAAESEILVVTPYFVPGKVGMEWINKLRERNIEITVITNSLASNNHLAAQSGYARYRKRLLQAGVSLYEIKLDEIPDYTDTSEDAESRTLHTKAAVIDREELYIGSMNFDPRSVVINTELGLFLEGTTAADAFYDGITRDLKRYTYRLELDEKGRVAWVDDSVTPARVYRRDPDTHWWRRFKAGFYGILPIESQL
ncbi:MAG: phospholipase D family protein [Halieaceae bacterium]